ncbi:hypothetical protein JW992_10560 [candidate division KSB1 bacterium]|nr:hypothetical protein [candidate division KSB1 bacterium]
MNRFRYLGISLILFFAVAGAAEWSEPILPLSEVEPGMSGHGLTVYSGTAIESFDFEVIDILENLYPRFDVILVRLLGDEADKSGIVSGMSGSPMYVEGRLIGALAMRFGQFMKEPIGAVMPIETMLQLLDYRSFSVDSVPRERQSGWMQPYLHTVLCGAEPDFWSQVVRQSPLSKPASTAALQPIPLPLVFSGVQSEVVGSFQPLFQQLGFVAMAGGTARATFDPEPPFQPGSAVAQLFVDGDVGISAVGTVTGVHENLLLAFGHQVFNLGPVRVPLAHARILATLPSLMGSSKMASTTAIAGVFSQDRLPGALGELDLLPRMIPVDLSMRHAGMAEKRYSFRMADDQALNNLTPLFLHIALFQAMVAARLASEPVTTRFTADFELENGMRLQLEDLFSTVQEFGMLETGSDVANASNLVASVLGVLMVNEFQTPAIKRVQLSAESSPGEQILRLKSVRQNRKTLTPGDTLSIWMTLQERRGRQIELHKAIPVPERIEADELRIIIGSGPALTRYEIQSSPQKFQPYDFDHLISLVRGRRRNDRLYVQVRVKDSGLYMRGEEMTALPPSILEIMDSQDQLAGQKKTADRVLAEYEIARQAQIRGARQLRVRIEQPGKAAQPLQNDKNNAIRF